LPCFEDQGMLFPTGREHVCDFSLGRVLPLRAHPSDTSHPCSDGTWGYLSRGGEDLMSILVKAARVVLKPKGSTIHSYSSLWS